jgi:predicted transport protein
MVQQESSFHKKLLNIELNYSQVQTRDNLPQSISIVNCWGEESFEINLQGRVAAALSL